MQTHVRKEQAADADNVEQVNRKNTEMLSTVFTITAKPGQKNIDAASSTIPANALSSTQSSSLQGDTTGVTGCILGVFSCKQSVSYEDINTLATQIEPGVKKQIAQDLQQQAHTKGVITLGNIIYSGEIVTANPVENSVSKTVTVTVSEQGNQEDIVSKDTHDIAQLLLKQQLKPQYVLMDALTQVSQPAIQNVDANGDVQINIAVGGVARYQISKKEITTIQDHIKGMTQKDARAAIAKYPDIDATSISIQLSYGDTIPNNIQQIKITSVNPTNPPPVKLTPLPSPPATT